jgi:hypothetical protein
MQDSRDDGPSSSPATYSPEDLGTARIDPAGTFHAGQKGTWRIIYSAGRFGMDDGGSILVAQRDMTDAEALQCERPERGGFVRARTTGDAEIRVGYDPWRWRRPFRGALVVSVHDGSLAPGDDIEVVMGGGTEGWVLQTFPETKHEFRVLVDPFGTRQFRPLAQHPHITVIPASPAGLDLVLPSVARVGEKVPVWARILDRWGNPIREFRGKVRIESDGDGVEGLPATFEMSRGVTRVGTATFAREGLFTLKGASGLMAGRSNPIQVSDAIGPIYWADLHGQTEDTIGTGTVEEYFRFAKDMALVNVTSWQGNDFQITDPTWHEVVARTKEFNQPGTFTTFLGYEWSGPTPGGGDHNIMYRDDDQPVLRSSRWQVEDCKQSIDYYPLARLWKELEGTEVMAVAHVGGRHANLDFWHPEFCSLVEIHSSHGSFDWLAQDAIKKGLQVGFVGGSDDHAGRPGLSPPLRRGGSRGSVRLDLCGGLTGILARELTREAVWKALRARHCFATTGARMMLDVRCEDFVMGDAVVADSPVTLQARAIGTGPLLDLEVIRDGDVIHRHAFTRDPEKAWVRLDWSGLRVRSRNKRAEWNATIDVSGGKIEDVVRLGFRREGDEIKKLSDNRLAISTTTAGDMVGVCLKVSGRKATVRFASPLVDAEVEVGELGWDPTEFEAGGLNLRLRMSLCCPKGRPDSASFEFVDQDPLGDGHAYWVKAVQLDGHCAWSSPIFVGPKKDSAA